MAVQTAIAFTDDEITVMAKIAYRQSQLGPRGEDIPMDEIFDAIYYIEQALDTIKLEHTYDPEAYARASAKPVLIQYAKAYLLGTDPRMSNEYITSLDRWLKAAARERYSNRPNSWPEYPEEVQRLRNHTHRMFDPDAQDESDF